MRREVMEGLCLMRREVMEVRMLDNSSRATVFSFLLPLRDLLVGVLAIGVPPSIAFDLPSMPNHHAQRRSDGQTFPLGIGPFPCFS